MSGSPDVSVVVPSVGRETRLAFLLEALQRQTLAAERYEVIVVRGRDPGEPAGEVEALGAKVVESVRAGPATLRNKGISAARGGLIAFTDDDCRPAPDWLERFVEAAEREDEGFLLQGRTEPDPGEIRRLHGLARTQSIVGPSGWYETCNMAYPRALLERLGGFDERFDGGGEDADLGLRALAQGARAVYVDSARVWHAVHSRHVWTALRDECRWQTIPLVVARHPAQRRMLELGIFWKAGHPRVLLALLGLLWMRRHPLLGVAAAVPYIRHHLRRYGRSPRDLVRAGVDLPGGALVDAAGAGATALGGVRHRSAVI